MKYTIDYNITNRKSVLRYYTFFTYLLIINWLINLILYSNTIYLFISILYCLKKGVLLEVLIKLSKLYPLGAE